MRQWIAVLLIFTLFAPVAVGQGAAKPKLDVEFEETEAAPGQFLTLRFTVLVPTWLPKPVEFPSLETPNIRVRLPEKSTTAISKPIDGETWSGVSRRYLIAPLVPGSFTIPPQELKVTYADSGGGPITEVMRTEAITFAGTVLEGAEGLDPFIAAEALTLEQKLEGEPEDMAPGASVRLEVTAHIEGVSPMVLPRLIPPTDLPGVAVYPEEPVVTEADERGALSGERKETVTLMAESGGSGRMPDVELRWFSLKTKKVETAKIDGFGVSVEAPPGSAGIAGRSYRPFVIALITIVAFGLAFRWGGPRLRVLVSERRRMSLASEGWADEALLRAVRQRDLSATYAALGEWAARKSDVDPWRAPAVERALAGIGAAHFGPTAPHDEEKSWIGLEEALAVLRRDPDGASRALSALPPLNRRARGVPAVRE
ncbi:protein BatD [Pikeienuella piscinae]|uniref:Protein BatD n=1 Tax=Pikeienuella piscinae TaxID=2748098 RepID=A0A7L5BV20_9RHOB|nr:BatD family protein [Pikeienuella piscinae]QIE55552.1 protein BatD [Pikeienuella piscinae]